MEKVLEDKCSSFIEQRRKYTLDKVIADGYDKKLHFEVLILPSF
jgi:hypothetical protein